MQVSFLNLKSRAPYRNIHLEPADYVSFDITMHEDCRIHVTVDATEVFWIVSVDIKGFEGQ